MLAAVEQKQRHSILSTALDKNSFDTIAHSNVDSVFEGKAVNSLIEHLVRLKNYVCASHV